MGLPDKKEHNKANGGRWDVGLPFSDQIQIFFKELAEVEWEKKAPSFVLVRDYEALPCRAPFDVDAMAGSTDLPTCRSVFKNISDRLGLICLTKTTSLGINILILELTDSVAHRTWSYFEVVTEKQVATDRTIKARDIDIDRSNGLPVPTNNWRFAINLLQSLRRDDLERYRPVLNECLRKSPGSEALVASMFGLERQKVTSILTGQTPLKVLRANMGIAVKPPKSMSGRPAWKTRLRLAFEKRFYLAPLRNGQFITIHGADGVGKTTACEMVTKMFMGYPINLNSFHHVTSWKSKGAIRPGAINASQMTAQHPKLPKISFRQLLRFCYKHAPLFVRDWWIAVTGYHHYGKNLNRQIFTSYVKQDVMVLDRYVYDMYLKLNIRDAQGAVGRFVGLVACKLMRRPLQAILIVDQPANIIQRKQELSLKEIEYYQRSMEQFLKTIRVPYTVINVEGRDAESIGRELARVTINTIGVDLIRLMKHTINPIQFK